MLRALALASVFALAACSAGTSSPGPDAGTPDAGSAAPDAGTASCSGACKPGSTGAADCECFFNDECGDGFRCGTVNNAGVCECGPRGTGGLNTPCTSPNDCASGVCYDVDSTHSYCSIRCDPAASQCSGTLGVCNPLLGFCADR